RLQRAAIRKRNGDDGIITSGLAGDYAPASIFACDFAMAFRSRYRLLMTKDGRRRFSSLVLSIALKSVPKLEPSRMIGPNSNAFSA
ncbi:MAG: hypothetical protein RMN24_07950, partial [Anaerolineae bacterium]|nr:hypothetical protein [Caldilineales bacterium]MDW8269081.1 hypothetical protein [Anaerolineae bacterium]